MTRTEDRLADALSARATAVREESLAPLAASPARRASSSWQGLRWLAPLAAALSVALVAALITLVAPIPSGEGPSAGFPARDYVWYRTTDANRPNQLVIRSARTGAIVGQVPDPLGVSGWIWLGAERGLRSYVAVTYCPGCHHHVVYRFRLTTAGHVTEMTVVRAVTIPYPPLFALAPDGSALAYSSVLPSSKAYRIGILNLRTGAERVWRDGVRRRPGWQFAIGTLTWSGDDRNLVFAGHWCRNKIPSTGWPACTAWTVRSLRAVATDSSLLSGSVLLRKDPVASGSAPPPVLSPDSSAVLQVVYLTAYSAGGGRMVQVARLTSIDLATGKQIMLHTWASVYDEQVYTFGGLVLAEVTGVGSVPISPPRIIGWVGQSGTLQPLPVGSPAGR